MNRVWDIFNGYRGSKIWGPMPDSQGSSPNIRLAGPAIVKDTRPTMSCNHFPDSVPHLTGFPFSSHVPEISTGNALSEVKKALKQPTIVTETCDATFVHHSQLPSRKWLLDSYTCQRFCL